MLRTALKLRWLALLALVLVAATIMARLGQWQLDRARENGSEHQQQAQRQAAAPLDGVLQAHQAFPRRSVFQPVSVTGTWDGAHQLLVADRRDITTAGGDVAGPHGFWVLTPLRRADGSAVPVVRGWVKSADDPAAASSAVPSGSVAVTGYLLPSEPPDDGRRPGQGTGLPAGQIDQVDVTQLIQVWPYPLLTGYLLLSEQSPAAPQAPTHLVSLRAGDSAMALQNVSYAIQWFLFAMFGVYVWWRLVREAHRGTLGKSASDSGGVGPVGAQPPSSGGAGARADRTGGPGTGDDAGLRPDADRSAGDPARDAAEPVGDDGSPTPAVGGTHP